jgi:hypothetical protein
MTCTLLVVTFKLNLASLTRTGNCILLGRHGEALPTYNVNIYRSSVVTNNVEVNCNAVDFLNFICICSFEDCLCFHMKTKKVKFPLEQAMKTQRGVEV